MDINLLIVKLASFFQGFLKSPFFMTLKFLLAIYVTVLFADLIMLLILRGFGDVRSSFKGTNIPLISPRKMKKRWRRIEERLASGEFSQYKIAIIEADRIIDKITSDMKFKGGNLVERLDNLKPGQIENGEELKEAHKMRNKIIHDPQFQVSRELAKETLGIYKKFLTENEFMEG